MSKNYLITGFIFTFVFGISRVGADEWMSIERKEFQSPSGKYIFRIVPDESSEYHPGYCKGSLLKISDNKQKLIWSRYLINNRGPVHVFPADSGKYVVTMDEWGEIGTFPIVIYGNKGTLIKVHNTESLGLESDIENIKITITTPEK